MEDRLSIELMNINSEYIQLQRMINTRRKNTHAVSNVLRYAISGDFRYILDRLRQESRGYGKTKDDNPVNKDSDRSIRSSSSFQEGIDKVVVYTVITGDYDYLKEPVYYNNSIDYICFTDQDICHNSAWKVIKIDTLDKSLGQLSLKEQSRYVKILPHRVFPDYKYSIYLDGSVRVIADMLPLVEQMGDKVIGVHNHAGRNCIYDEGSAIVALGKATKSSVNNQLEKYREENYPPRNGLYQCSIIIREHNNQDCKKAMQIWWDEYINTETKRDQLSFPYAIWKSGFRREDIFILGNNWLENPRFRCYQHA